MLAVIALVHGWVIKDLWLGGSAAAASGTEPLRVASANVLSSNPEPEKALSFVRASDADVVVVVEAQGERWRDVLAAIGANYAHRAPEGWQDGSHHPVQPPSYCSGLSDRLA